MSAPADLELRAMKHAAHVEALLRGPHAMIVPAAVREALREQSRVLQLVAAELEQLRAVVAAR